jgi:hypothetical protein
MKQSVSLLLIAFLASFMLSAAQPVTASVMVNDIAQLRTVIPFVPVNVANYIVNVFLHSDDVDVAEFSVSVFDTGGITLKSSTPRENGGVSFGFQAKPNFSFILIVALDKNQNVLGRYLLSRREIDHSLVNILEAK